MKTIQNTFHMCSGNFSSQGSLGAQPRIRSAFMRKDLLAIGLGMVLSGAAVFSSFAAGSTLTLRGHVPPVVVRGSAADLGAVDADQPMELSIGLPLRNRAALTNLIEQLSDPKSPNYGHYLTTKQFTDAFGPTEKDYQAVIEFARSNGLKPTRMDANRMLVHVSGRAGDIEKAFGVALHRYEHPTEQREFFAPANEPSVPAGLQIQDVEGLDSFRRAYSHYRQTPGTTAVPVQTAAPKVHSKSANPNAGSGPTGLYMGDDFRNAYVPGTTLNGSGQTVALVQFDGYFASDITSYETLTGRPNVPLQNVLIDGFSGIPTGSGGEVEVSLDIEMVIAMAPGVSKIILYEGSPFNFFPNDVLNQIALDNSARQVSSSWGWNGGPNLTTDQIFQQMAVQGQTYFNATGDSDAFLPGDLDNPFFIGEPSSNPFITQVGGTTLTMNGAGGAYASETVWNWGLSRGQDGVGSSGGISSFYAIPSWQTNINMTVPQGSQVNRNVPDVAMVGDNVLVIADGNELSVGGTSCAAPLWGGFTALVNQQAATSSHGPVGFINPVLYAIANSPNYNSSFHDTITGNNTWSSSPTRFFAQPGYDLCTGLGSPSGNNLITAMLSTQLGTGPVHISPPRPPYSTNMSGFTGGNPNGSWFMFIQDDAPVSSGLIANGWILSLTTADVIGTAGDVELLMGTTNTSVLAGQPVTYVLTATNYGPSISTNVSVVDNLPDGVTLVSTNATQGTVSRSGSTLIWAIGTLNVGSGAGLTVTVRPLGNGALVDSANVDTGTPDPNPDDDFATATVNVIPLSVSLTPSFGATNHQFQINVPLPSGVTIVIQANSNLVSTNWVNVYTGTPPVNFTDPATSNYVSRFYRALILP